MKDGMVLSPQQALEKRKIKFAYVGLGWALLAALTWAFQGNIMEVAGGMWPFSDPKYTVMMVAVAAIVTGGLHDFFAGIWLLIYNLVTGRGIKEYLRLGSTKIGTMMLLAAFFGGPMATGSYLIGVNMCGVTYAAAIAGTSPIIGAIVGRIVFKENMNKRIWFGIILAVIGVLIVSYSPPEGDYPFFVVGLIASIFAAVGWGLEGVCATYAADMTDSTTACGLYRCFGSALITILLFIPIFSGLAGDVSIGFKMIANGFSSVTPILWIAGAAIAGGLSYLSIYNAFPRAGVGRSLTVNVTYSLWSIPVGFLFLALGIGSYAVTGQAIIGCVVIFVGVALVIANPKDLLNLREN